MLKLKTLRSRGLSLLPLTALFAVLGAVCGSVLAQSEPYAAARNLMVRTVEARLNKARVQNDRYRSAVIAAIGKTPRHLFVAAAQQADAYHDTSLPIGHDQTISDPLIVAAMTTLLKVKTSDKVLEIGTGSGYQAAILSQLAGEVYTIEIIAPLAAEATARLARLGYANVHVRDGDGYAGWPEQQPFDAIIVTAGAAQIPPALINQLKLGGRMIIPLGPNWAQEELVLVEKRSNGKVRQHRLGQVFFVPLTRGSQR